MDLKMLPIPGNYAPYVGFDDGKVISLTSCYVAGLLRGVTATFIKLTEATRATF